MATRKHVHEETFDVTPERLFAILYTPSAIRGWWCAARATVLPQRGGLWMAAWGASEDDPDYISAATIREFEPPMRMVLSDFRYYAKDGPLPFEAQFVTEFTVTPHGADATLRVVQDGFPMCAEADAFYAACERGWRDTFTGIRRFLAES